MRVLAFIPVLVLAATASHSAASPNAPRELLPDLDAVAPGQLAGDTKLTARGPRFLLGFDSAADNRGRGPLVVVGRRATTRERTMQAVQLIRRSDGSTRTVRGAGVLRYVNSADHSHWHLVPFMRYELRSAATGKPVGRDNKTGFCLGDRYESQGPKLPAKPAQPVWTEECGRNRPNDRVVREGISVGYGDDYHALLEGQSIDVTRLRAGRYVLVHRVNPDSRLRETTYANNAASMLLELRWPGGYERPPSVTVVRRCTETAQCPARS